MRVTDKKGNRIFIVTANRRPEYEEYFRHDKHFAYAHLGMLSTTFAEIEERLQDMLLDITQNENILAGYFLERNGLDKNIKLLMSINKAERFEEVRLKQVQKRLDKIRKVRNSLIHGAWNIFPSKENSGTKILVKTSQLQFKIVEKNTYYEDKTNLSFTLSEIQEHLKEAFSILLELEKIHSLLLDRNSKEDAAVRMQKK